MDEANRIDLIERLIEADLALFADGNAISHRDAAEAALRVVEDHIYRAVSPQITDAELDAAASAWFDALDLDDSREAMRRALRAFLAARGASCGHRPASR